MDKEDLSLLTRIEMFSLWSTDTYTRNLTWEFTPCNYVVPSMLLPIVPKPGSNILPIVG